MEATLKFNLPEENLEFQIHSDAMNMHCALFDVLSNLQRNMEWLMESDEELAKNGYALLDKAMEYIYDKTKDIKSLES